MNNKKASINKNFWFLMVLGLMLQLGAIPTQAAKAKYFTNGNLFYRTISKNQVEVCGTTATSGELVIPSKVEYKGVQYTVKGIADNKLYYQDVAVTEDTTDGSSVALYYPGERIYQYERSDKKEMPAKVSSIAGSNISKVVLPGTLSYIGDGAFNRCWKLKNVVFAKKYKNLSIGKDAFSSTGLKKIAFPQGTVELKANATGTIPEIQIPASVKKIGPSVVNYKTKKVTISRKNKKYKMKKGILYTKDEKTLVGASAAAGNKVTVSSKTTTIGECAFALSKVKEVALTNRVTAIGKGAFASCGKLMKVSGMEQVTTIDYAAFKGCVKLQTIGDISNVRTIARAAFWQDIQLVLAIHSGMVIDDYAFSGSVNDTCVQVQVPEKDTTYSYVNDLLIKTGADKKTVIMQRKDVEKVVVPEGVTTVAVVLGGLNCKEITLPATLKEQGGGFYIKEGSIQFQNLQVPVFQSDFDIHGGRKVKVIVPKGSLNIYKKTMNDIVVKRDDVDLFWGDITIEER